MRHSDLARIEFEQAKSIMGETSANDPLNVHHVFVARGLVELAIAIRDIYDKLEVIDRKLSASKVPFPIPILQQSR